MEEIIKCRTCTGCGKIKDESSFRWYNTRGYFNSKCKECEKVYLRERRRNTNYSVTKTYEKTKSGFIMRMYRNMKTRINGSNPAKKHLYDGKYLLPKEDFYTWINTNTNFDELFEVYESSKYDRRLAPSVDRIDSSDGYRIGNMRLVTSSVNSGNVDQRKKKLNNSRR